MGLELKCQHSFLRLKENLFPCFFQFLEAARIPDLWSHAAPTPLPPLSHFVFLRPSWFPLLLFIYFYCGGSLTLHRLLSSCDDGGALILWLWCAGRLHRGGLSLWSTGSRVCVRVSGAVAQQLSCFKAHGIFPDQEWNPVFPAWV